MAYRIASGRLPLQHNKALKKEQGRPCKPMTIAATRQCLLERCDHCGPALLVFDSRAIEYRQLRTESFKHGRLAPAPVGETSKTHKFQDFFFLGSNPTGLMLRPAKSVGLADQGPPTAISLHVAGDCNCKNKKEKGEKRGEKRERQGKSLGV